MASSDPRVIAAAREALAPLLTSDRKRILVGIAGAPAAGKSTLATSLAASLCGTDGPDAAVAVGMDGFHLANAELERLGRAARKGAPDTFDAYGFAALIGRLRDPVEPVVYAPVYSRVVHESVGSAIPVAGSVRVVIVEGNYLLLPRPPWSDVRARFDLTIYLETPTPVRVDSLVRRQRARGLDRDAAREWVFRSDEANAELVGPTSGHADVILRRPG